MAQQRENEKLTSPEVKIAELVQDTTTRIAQMYRDIRKIHGEGPELRYQTPDKINDPENSFNKIDRLGKSIENLKAASIKKTFELAEDLPKDKQREAIKSAFSKLAPEMSENDIEKQRRLTVIEKFDHSITPDFNSGRDSRDKNNRNVEKENKDQNSISKSKFIRRYNNPTNDKVKQESDREKE